MKCCLYVRVSDPRKGQTTENQLLQLQTFAKSKNWKVVEVYQDLETGGGTKVRPSYERLYEDAAKPNRRWDLLVFWSLDRFSREGVYPTIHRLRKLQDLGVSFVSYQEQYLDTLGPFREAVMGILAAVPPHTAVETEDLLHRGREWAGSLHQTPRQGAPVHPVGGVVLEMPSVGMGQAQGAAGNGEEGNHMGGGVMDSPWWVWAAIAVLIFYALWPEVSSWLTRREK